jgi:glutathione S-transferase
MRVYGNPVAPTTQMVFLTIAEKGHQAELVPIDLSTGEQRLPTHLLRHPFGLTPVLEDEQGSFIEARAILRYLDRALPGPSLTPATSQAFGRMEQFIGIEQAYFSPSIMLFYYRKFLGRQTSSATLESARSTAGKALDLAEAALAKGPYLAGESYSLADIAWMPYLAIAEVSEQGELIAARPQVDRYWHRLKERPAWQGLMAPYKH